MIENEYQEKVITHWIKVFEGALKKLKNRSEGPFYIATRNGLQAQLDSFKSELEEYSSNVE